MNRIGYIYKITSPNGRIYIGKTCRPNDRISNYRTNINTKSQPLLHNSIKKYGWDKHVFEIIDQTTVDLLSDLEIEHIKKHQSFHKDNPNGMNLTRGGDGSIGRVDSVEIRKKRAEKLIGTKRTEETKKLMSSIKKGITTKRLGTKHTKESIEKMSNSKKGKIQTIKTIEKRLETRKQNLIKKHGPILQIDKNTKKVIKEWVDSVKNISRQTGIDDSGISKCLKNKRNEVRGFIWKYKYQTE